MLVELIGLVVPDAGAVRHLVIDNAANRDTRDALIEKYDDGDTVAYRIRPGSDPAATPLGSLLLGLAGDLGLKAGRFETAVGPFGMLKIRLETSGPAE